MRTNGTLQYTKTSSPQVNEYGETTEKSVEWSEYVDCYIETNNDSKAKYEDGEYRSASFTVLTESPIPYTTKTVKLIRYAEELGTFEVQSLQHIKNLSRFKIVV